MWFEPATPGFWDYETPAQQDAQKNAEAPITYHIIREKKSKYVSKCKVRETSVSIVYECSYMDYCSLSKHAFWKLVL